MEKVEIAILPKGTQVQIMGCRIALIEDTKVEGSQSNIDYILKEQENFSNGVGVIGSAVKDQNLSIAGLHHKNTQGELGAKAILHSSTHQSD